MAVAIPEQQTIIKPWPDYLDLLALHAVNPACYPYLLAGTSQQAIESPQRVPTDRYDILMAFPQASIELRHDGLHFDEMESTEQHFLSALDDCWQRAGEGHGPDPAHRDLPFHGGWFIYLGYELAAEVEPTLDLPIDPDSSLPLALATRIPLAVINDRHTRQSYLVCEKAYLSLLDTAVADIARLAGQAAETEGLQVTLQEDPPDKFVHGVARVKEYIREGDVFQVNLSRRWQGRTPHEVPARTVFKLLANTNPAPYAGMACFAHAAIISSSPERLACVKQDRLETRPIAGTRPRGHDSVTDRKNLQELIGHPKERAEHVMLIDLERNDLGRVCRPGSVEVNELMVLESYAHVHHIVSNVRGILKAGCTPGEVIRAVFPGGTITGCPKVRCMEIIAELEQQARGPYTGAMGYLNHNGDMDLNILIRTIVIDKDTISFRAGAGLVADSVAEHELAETRAKARGMLLSLQGDAK